MTIGDTVTTYDPGSKREHESWTRGVIRETLPKLYFGHPVHIVTINGFKWDRDAPWGPSDGVPEMLVYEKHGLEPGEVEWLDTYPPRRVRLT